MIKFNKEDIFVVSGGSSGFGKAICMKLNSLGATVIAIARNEEKLNQVKLESEFPDNIFTVSKDLSDLDSIPLLIKDMVKNFGKLKGFVHSAGIIDIMPLKGIRIHKIKEMFDVNFFAGLALAKGFSDRRVARENAALVFLSSAVSICGQPGMIQYTSTKGAINSMVKSMALELSKTGIRANSVLPAHIKTEMADLYDEVYSKEYKQELETMYPLGPGEPEDVANLVIFLLSDASRWITGQNIIIDGGRTLI
ncbi:MAG: SDR family oxidoreductase [Desulfobacteraceae bacterium]|nr:SDR family oxidoreductase [Desulfobacteraceae bacterium]